MLADVSWVNRKYAEFAQRFFGNRMPEISVKIGRSIRCWGLATCNSRVEDGKIRTFNFVITISNAYESGEKTKETTLLHEMIHIYDYYNHPEHFYYMDLHGRFVKNRAYDAHGPELFLPMAESINRHGYNITRYVNDEEKADSTLSTATKKRMEKPFNLCYAEYMSGSNMLFFCTDTTLNNIKERYKRPELDKYAPISITVYKISNPEIRKQYSFTIGNAIRGYRVSMDKWFDLLVRLNLDEREPDDIIYFKSFDVENMFESSERKIIRLTESDLRNIISETLMELMGDGSESPVDGGNAVAKQVSPDSIELSIV
jgi:hypothetical protein